MICYRDQSYCSDQDTCATTDQECAYRLTKQEGNRADALGFPIAWLSFKQTCVKYKENIQ